MVLWLAAKILLPVEVVLCSQSEYHRKYEKWVHSDEHQYFDGYQGTCYVHYVPDSRYMLLTLRRQIWKHGFDVWRICEHSINCDILEPSFNFIIDKPGDVFGILDCLVCGEDRRVGGEDRVRNLQWVTDISPLPSDVWAAEIIQHQWNYQYYLVFGGFTRYSAELPGIRWNYLPGIRWNYQVFGAHIYSFIHAARPLYRRLWMPLDKGIPRGVIWGGLGAVVPKKKKKKEKRGKKKEKVEMMLLGIPSFWNARQKCMWTVFIREISLRLVL